MKTPTIIVRLIGLCLLYILSGGVAGVWNFLRHAAMNCIGANESLECHLTIDGAFGLVIGLSFVLFAGRWAGLLTRDAKPETQEETPKTDK